MKKFRFYFTLIIFANTCLFAQKVKLINSKTEATIDSIISIMTIEEKIGQINQYSANWWDFNGICTVKPEHLLLIEKGEVGSFLNIFGSDITEKLQKIAVTKSRLKIPLLFALDVIHGFKTTFPVPLAEASSWDMDVIFNSARYQAIEAASNGVHWTFNPMVDIARDPRWGRIVEGAGEDPYLGSQIAKYRVLGYQGNNFTLPHSIFTCPKHFAAYGAVEGGRDYNSVDISETTLFNVYLPPFISALNNGAGTLMCSFNEIGSIPSSANKHLLRDILKSKLGFQGLVVSDWNSVGELINHGIALDSQEAALLSINAGVDIDMESNSYFNNLKELINTNKIDIKVINDAVKRVLRVKFALGLFDNPYKYCNKSEEKQNTLTSEMIDFSRESAKKSIVLLKNNDNILPLTKDIKSIAIIGYLANSKKNPLGSWEQLGDSNNVVTLLDGIKNKLNNSIKIDYSVGCFITDSTRKYFSEAIELAKNSDYVILNIGEDSKMTGEAKSKSNINLPGIQEELAKEIYKVNKNLIVVLSNGRPLTINWLSENVPAILETWFLGLQSGNAIADVIFGDYNPSAKLPVTFPRSTGQIPIYYNHKSTGRPSSDNLTQLTSRYIDLSSSPLYPFGFGLSYSTYKYSNLRLDKKSLNESDSLKVSIDIDNLSNRDGNEVVQLYIQDITASITRPVKELKAFKKVFIPANTKTTINFTLKNEDLAFYNNQLEFVSETGKFKVFVGTNSEEVLENSFELIK